MSEVQTKINGIRAKYAERDFLLAVLEMWNEVQGRGVDPNEVDAMGYRPRDLSMEFRRALRRAANTTRRDPITGQPLTIHAVNAVDPYPGERLANGKHSCVVLTYARLKSGEEIVFDPPIKAPPKDPTK